MKWSDEEIKMAVALLQQQQTYENIAIKLQRTSNSVRNKLQELGFKFSDEQQVIKECLNCFSTIETTFKNPQKFCSNSCSATYNNKLRRKSANCLKCHCEIDAWRKFCSKRCAGDYKQNETFTAIENGNLSFSEQTFKRYLIYKYGNKCMECGWCEKNKTTGNVPIQLEHIDGNSDNNDLNNLKLLCPNCHSLTPTYGALNKGNGRDSKRKEKRKERRLKIEGDA